jgi:hypothetical protein
MRQLARRIAREVKAMTKKEVLLKAIDGKITWLQAADILGMTARHLRRVRAKYEQFGFNALTDGRGGKRRCRIKPATIAELLRLKRERYAEFSVQHFHEFVTEKHKLKVSYTWTKHVLQEAGLVERAPGRGKYRRKRERRPMVGMLVHLDASMHRWIEGLPMRDLVVALDDADGRILYAQFVEQEGTDSTFRALDSILRRCGRFCELYTDRGSHFGRTSKAGEAPADLQNGQVARALKLLGIRHILARSPEARGRSERAFGTIQGRLPQELRLAGIADYVEANQYLVETFGPDFNRRFTVTPSQRESAFVPVRGIDLGLLLSSQHERIVRNDSTVSFEKILLQLPSQKERRHYVRCPVRVHELLDGTLGVTHQDRLLARYTRHGTLLSRTVHSSRNIDVSTQNQSGHL